MNAKELFLSNGKSAGVFYCEQCKYVKRTPEEAEQCCASRKCQRCGNPVEKYYLSCPSCTAADDIKKEVDRFNAAEKLKPADYDGWLYLEGTGYKEGYFESVEDFLDWIEDSEFGIPSYAWCCAANQFATGDVSDVIDRIMDNSYEDFEEENLNGVPELKAAIEAFNEANKHHLSYSPDYKRCVVFNAEDLRKK